MYMIVSPLLDCCIMRVTRVWFSIVYLVPGTIVGPQ
jgi:hypothetical protein